MSKASELDQKVKRYILERIDGTGYGRELKTTADKIRFLEETFNSEYGFMIERHGRTTALKEWYAGLPSAVSIDFTNYDILQLAVKWGSIPENATEKQKDTILENWFNLLAVKTGQLFDGFRIPKETENAG